MTEDEKRQYELARLGDASEVEKWSGAVRQSRNAVEHCVDQTATEQDAADWTCQRCDCVNDWWRTECAECHAPHPNRS